MEQKLKALKTYLKELGSVAVAYSSGVDSTFLLKTAHEVLGDKAVAITVQSSLFPKRELEEAIAFCEEGKIRHIIIELNELEDMEFTKNPINRCYLCKKKVFKMIKEAAIENGLQYVVEGSNMDDLNDYRPGMKAIVELEIKSPLRVAGLSKNEIRKLSQAAGLKTYCKPSFACLASRFVYGEAITEEKLLMVDQAEQLLLDLGFHQFRVRIHGTLARIEVLPEEFDKMMKVETREKIASAFRSYGFSYVTMDLTGYRMGSMNEVIQSTKEE